MSWFILFVVVMVIIVLVAKFYVWCDERIELSHHVNYGVLNVTFEEFYSYYQLNPDRYILDDYYVLYNLTPECLECLSEDHERIGFKTLNALVKYKKFHDELLAEERIKERSLRERKILEGIHQDVLKKLEEADNCAEEAKTVLTKRTETAATENLSDTLVDETIQTETMPVNNCVPASVE